MRLLNTYTNPSWFCVEAVWKPKQYLRCYTGPDSLLILAANSVCKELTKIPLTYSKGKPNTPFN